MIHNIYESGEKRFLVLIILYYEVNSEIKVYIYFGIWYIKRGEIKI